MIAKRGNEKIVILIIFLIVKFFNIYPKKRAKAVNSAIVNKLYKKGLMLSFEILKKSSPVDVMSVKKE